MSNTLLGRAASREATGKFFIEPNSRAIIYVTSQPSHGNSERKPVVYDQWSYRGVDRRYSIIATNAELDARTHGTLIELNRNRVPLEIFEHYESQVA